MGVDGRLAVGGARRSCRESWSFFFFRNWAVLSDEQTKWITIFPIDDARLESGKKHIFSLFFGGGGWFHIPLKRRAFFVGFSQALPFLVLLKCRRSR